MNGNGVCVPYTKMIFIRNLIHLHTAVVKIRITTNNDQFDFERTTEKLSMFMKQQQQQRKNQIVTNESKHIFMYCIYVFYVFRIEKGDGYFSFIGQQPYIDVIPVVSDRENG